MLSSLAMTTQADTVPVQRMAQMCGGIDGQTELTQNSTVGTYRSSTVTTLIGWACPSNLLTTVPRYTMMGGLYSKYMWVDVFVPCCAPHCYRTPCVIVAKYAAVNLPPGKLFTQRYAPSRNVILTDGGDYQYNNRDYFHSGWWTRVLLRPASLSFFVLDLYGGTLSSTSTRAVNRTPVHTLNQ